MDQVQVVFDFIRSQNTATLKLVEDVAAHGAMLRMMWRMMIGFFTLFGGAIIAILGFLLEEYFTG